MVDVQGLFIQYLNRQFNAIVQLDNDCVDITSKHIVSITKHIFFYPNSYKIVYLYAYYDKGTDLHYTISSNIYKDVSDVYYSIHAIWHHNNDIIYTIYFDANKKWLFYHINNDVFTQKQLYDNMNNKLKNRIESYIFLNQL